MRRALPCGCYEAGSFGPFARLWAAIRQRGLAAGTVRLLWHGVRRSGRFAVDLPPHALTVLCGHPGHAPIGLVLFGALLEPEYDLVQRGLLPAAVVFDVGGGIGTYAMVAARRAAAAVHLFEPHPANLERVRANLARNGCSDRVRVLPVAVSSREGFTTLRRGGGPFTSRIGVVGDQQSPDTVPAVTLDAHCARFGIERVDLLKVDVEGHEADVLSGAVGLLAARRIGVVVFEIGPSLPRSRAILANHGYRLFHYVAETATLHPVCRDGHARDTRPSALHCNLVAVAPTSGVLPLPLPRLHPALLSAGSSTGPVSLAVAAEAPWA